LHIRCVALVIARDCGSYLDYAPYGAPLGMTSKKMVPFGIALA
jgi:hypothetical protein